MEQLGLPGARTEQWGPGDSQRAPQPMGMSQSSSGSQQRDCTCAHSGRNWPPPCIQGSAHSCSLQLPHLLPTPHPVTSHPSGIRHGGTFPPQKAANTANSGVFPRERIGGHSTSPSRQHPLGLETRGGRGAEGRGGGGGK